MQLSDFPGLVTGRCRPFFYGNLIGSETGRPKRGTHGTSRTFEESRRLSQAGTDTKSDSSGTRVQDTLHPRQPSREGQSGNGQTRTRFHSWEGEARKARGNRPGEKTRQGREFRCEHSPGTAGQGRSHTRNKILGQGFKGQDCFNSPVEIGQFQGTQTTEQTVARDWVDLSRRYSPLTTETGAADDLFGAESGASRLFDTTGGMTWEQLLTSRFVIVLGEAGAGKTAEFRAEAGRLAGQGKPAFFIPIEDLSQLGLEELLGVDDQRRLEVWKSNDTSAFFFLDSIDESRLSRERNPVHALRRLRSSLGENYPRVHVLLSCRLSDWRYRYDETEFQEYHPLFSRLSQRRYSDAPIATHFDLDPNAQSSPEDLPAIPSVETDSEESNLRVVHIDSLDRNQVGKLASWAGVSDSDAFLEALDRHNVIQLATRPLDVLWLARHWRTHGRFGTLREIIDENIKNRLCDVPSRRPSLSLDRLESGLRQLAGLATLSAQFAFQIESDDGISTTQRGLLPSQFLPDWSKEEIRELLSTGIFDGETYGRVRIHHREVQYFLAANWLSSLIGKGFSRRVLNGLLFPMSWGQHVVPRHLLPTATWLSLWDNETFQLVLDLSPQSYLTHGDPSSLSIDQRREVLRQFLDSVEAFERFSDDFGRSQLALFAHAELAPTICESLKADDLGEDARALLLRIAWWGALSGVVSEAIRIATDSSISHWVRLFAVRVIHDAGSDNDRSALLPLLSIETEPDLLAALLEALFPAHAGLDEFVNAVIRAKPDPNHYSMLHRYFLQELPTACPHELKSTLLERLLSASLIASQPNRYGIRPESAHLLPALYGLVGDFANSIKEANRVPEVALVAYSSLSRLEPNPDLHRYGESEFERAVSGSPEFRRAFFWWTFDRESQSGKVPRRYVSTLSYSWDFRIGADDLEWLVNDAESLTNPAKRQLAFRIILDMTPRDQIEFDNNPVLNKLVTERPEFQKRFDRHRRSMTWNHTLPENGKWVREDKARKLRQIREIEESKKVLLDRLGDIRNASDDYLLAHLFSITDRDSSSRSVVDIAPVVSKYGNQIAQASIEGWRASWRKRDPGLPHERKEKDKSPYYIVYGLAGIAFDISNGVQIAQLSKDLGMLAIRYAAWELNEFPPWLFALALARPEWLRETLKPAIEYEFAIPATAEPPYDVLSKLSHPSTNIRTAIAPMLCELLQTKDPTNTQVLEWVLRAIGVFDGMPVEGLAANIRGRLIYSVEDVERFGLWWCVLFNSDSISAVKSLAESLEAMSETEADIMFLHLAGQLGDRRFGMNVDTSMSGQVGALASFVSLAYRHIRPEDDVTHVGVYSPGLRDHAQDFRSRLLQELLNIRTKEGFNIQGELLSDPALKSIHPWISDRLRTFADLNPEIGPLSPDQALAWFHTESFEPSTATHLHDLALNRILDITNSVERHDFSQRAVYNLDSVNEDAFQRFIADELRRRSHNLYIVTREEEVEHRGEPDIRIHSQNVTGKVAVEIKVAEKWSGSKLLGQLETQLVEKYLATETSRHGIYVLCSRGHPRKWEIGGRRVNFSELVEALQEKAETIQISNPIVMRLDVLGIDFHEKQLGNGG